MILHIKERLLRTVLIGLLGSLLLCFNVFANEELTVYFLDVGQADCALYVQGEHTMLIDAGNNGDGKEIVEFIKSKGIKKLDYVIGTHPHEDHIGGLDDVLNSFDVGTLFMSEKATTTKTFKDVVEAIKKNKVKLVAPSFGKEFMLGDASVRVITDKTKVNKDSTDLNSFSVGIKIDYSGRSILSCGDLDKEGEDIMLDNFKEDNTKLRADVYKVSHHGSRTASTDNFLSAINANYAIIQTEEGNSYGHPHKEVMGKLDTKGIKVYRNDSHGNITLHITEEGNLVFDLERLPEQVEKPNTDLGNIDTSLVQYTLNKSSHKIHKMTCRYAKSISDSNKLIVDSLVFDGHENYTVCGSCFK